MNNFRLIKETLKYLYESRYSNILTPEGWGVRVEGMHATNPNRRDVQFFYSNFRDAICVSDGLRMIAVPSEDRFIHEDPNQVFFEVNEFNHHYRLGWHNFVVPSPYLEWLTKRVQEFLYPFDEDLLQPCPYPRRLWWVHSRRVSILIAHPVFVGFDEDGIATFEPYTQQPQTLLGGMDDGE